ncbi:uncharacterized protein N7477_007953 [Penicillium maclennaniae]|uniref:uncharacterized protein n=1 Tax=Penicillium maclennaniae TaxID=1343394 RepID=UPI00253F95A3|nr:uncharacterized protein N7477_007953 [Penicillium maclennaniae]KAJ5665505.1 hypothetical protein N7477_007953 [Penicillium maclennaniae]
MAEHSKILPISTVTLFTIHITPVPPIHPTCSDDTFAALDVRINQGIREVIHEASHTPFLIARAV